MNKLANCKKLEIRSSPIEGFGVFATEDIQAGEVLEEVPFVLFPRSTSLSKNIYDLLNGSGFLSQKEKFAESLRLNLKFKEPEKYYFKWFPTHGVDGDPLGFTVLPLGYGPVYNTANVDNNAGWTIREKTFVFKAEKNIAKDEEIRTFYGYFLGDDGAIFNCDQVFNLALDVYDGQVKCKMVKFGELAHFEAAKLNPVYANMVRMFTTAKNGLNLTRISALTPTNEEKAAFDFPANFSLTAVYNKIQEYKLSPFPFIKIKFTYEHKESGDPIVEELIFKK